MINTRKLVGLLLAMGFMPSGTHAASPKSAPWLNLDLVGKWQWTVPKNGCIETIEFFADGTRFVVSGEERSDSTYVVEAVPNSPMRKLLITTTKDHGGVDCGGSSDDDTGSSWSIFFMLNKSKDQMLSCYEAKLGDCIGPYRRVKP